MCDKIVSTHSFTIQFVPEWYKTQKMCDEAFNKYFLNFFKIPGEYKTPEMCDRIIFDKAFSRRYVQY